MDNEQDTTRVPINETPEKSEPPGIVFSSGKVEIIISDDNYKCWIKVSKTTEGAMPDKTAALEAIEEKNIVKDFINEEELNRVFDEMISDREVLIAEGKPKKDGKDGSVKYHFRTTISDFLQEDEQGRVDYKEVNFIQQVQTGDVIAELIPPEEGVNGLTVTGEEIQAKDGVPAQLPAGNNTEISKDDPNKLIATIDGSVSLKMNKVNIDPIVVIDGDVDYSSGNINYKGAVTIKGGVKAGFTINSESDVTINDVVEDAVIRAEGRVVLKSGFIGKGTGRIVAGGDVILPFAENQFIFSGKDVIVSDALLHCTVEADGKVVVSGSKGIIGGSISAFDAIEAESAGSQTYTKTVLRVGLKRVTREKVNNYYKDKETHKANVEKVKKAIHVLDKINLLKRGLPPKQQKLYDSLVVMQKKLLEEKKVLAKIMKELDEEYKQVENSEIKINQRIYPGVRIEFGKVKRIVQEHGIGVLFKFKDNEITAIKQIK